MCSNSFKTKKHKKFLNTPVLFSLCYMNGNSNSLFLFIVWNLRNVFKREPGHSTYCSRPSVQLSAPMVGHNDALDPVLHSQLGVLLCQNPLDNDGQACQGLQPVDVLPADGWVQSVGWDAILFRTVVFLQLKTKSPKEFRATTRTTTRCVFFCM